MNKVLSVLVLISILLLSTSALASDTDTSDIFQMYVNFMEGVWERVDGDLGPYIITFNSNCLFVDMTGSAYYTIYDSGYSFACQVFLNPVDKTFMITGGPVGSYASYRQFETE